MCASLPTPGGATFGWHDFLNDPKADGSMTLEPGQHARFMYRIVIHPGQAPERIAELFQGVVGNEVTRPEA